MQKRVNPLEVKSEEHKLTKRVNPLVLGDKKDVEDKILIDSMPEFKKKFVFIRISKELLSLLKETYPNQKVSRILEYTMLTHLNSINKDSLDGVLKEKSEWDKV